MTNPLYALTDHDHTENERNKTMRKHSKTMSMGLMPTPYLVQLETFISPGLPYLSLIGFPDEDHRRIRDRIRSACEAVGCGLPACRTTVNLMPASMPKLPGLCVLACAVSILAADGRIPSAERLEDTIILGDVNEDGTIPPVDADLTDLAAYAARRLEIRRIIIPSANLAGTTIPRRRRGHRTGPHRRAAEPVTADAENAVADHRKFRRSATSPNRPDSRQTCMD